MPPARPRLRPTTWAALLGGALAGLAVRRLPALLHGRLQLGVLRAGQGGRGHLALTLDASGDRIGGGPDEAVLRALLEALGGVGATLFLPADWAARNAAWAGPLLSGRELGLQAGRGRMAAQQDALEDALGRARWVRPAAGYGPLTLRRARRAGLLPVGHTLPRPGWDGTLAALLDQVEPGEVLALPISAHTAALLPALLPELRRRGYRVGPLSALPGLRAETGRGLVQRAWRRLGDDRFDASAALISLTERANAVFRISAAHAYRGPPLRGRDGRDQLPGTCAVELHLHGRRLVGLAGVSALTGFRAFRDSLHDVAEALQTRPELSGVQMVYGLTLFHELLDPVGFQTQALPPLQGWVQGYFMNLLRRMYDAPNATHRMIVPRLVWMDRETLMARYGRGRGL